MDPVTTSEDVGPTTRQLPQRPTDLPGPLLTDPILSTTITQSQVAAATAFPRLPIPPLTENNVDGYFYSMEFWFKASGVVDDARKYNTVLSQVPPSKLMDLRMIIDKTPSSGRYEYIKDELIKHYADSQQRRLRRVLGEMTLGDQKPSQLFNSMQRVADGAFSEAALIELWSTRLPAHTHAAVAASEGSIQSKLRIADVINESMDLRQGSQVAAMTEAPTSVQREDPHQAGMLELVSNINAIFRDRLNLGKQNFRKTLPTPIAASQGRPNVASNAPRQNGPSSTVRRQLFAQPTTTRNSRQVQHSSEDPEAEDWSAGHAQTTATDVTCWYHRRFGNEALSCRQPCSFGNQ
jgi:hypothetical protein